jgi:hypothetical protein
MSSPQPCTQPATPGVVVGAACLDCGHTSLLHHGPMNPDVPHCLVCALLLLLDRLTAASDDSEDPTDEDGPDDRT